MRTLLLCVAVALIAGAAPALAADPAAADQAAARKGSMSSVNNNPLYEESGSKGENPLFEAKSDLRQGPKDGPRHSSDASAGKGAEKTAQPPQSNPLHDDKGHSGENPLYESK